MFMFPLKIVHRTKYLVEILASNLVAQGIDQKFVQGYVSSVYSLKLRHSEELSSQDEQNFRMTFDYVSFFFF